MLDPSFIADFTFYRIFNRFWVYFWRNPLAYTHVTIFFYFYFFLVTVLNNFSNMHVSKGISTNILSKAYQKLQNREISSTRNIYNLRQKNVFFKKILMVLKNFCNTGVGKGISLSILSKALQKPQESEIRSKKAFLKIYSLRQKK